MPEHLFFYLGLSFILMHEMDAVRCKEWRIFPGLSLLSDRLGFQLFMWLHVPLFAIIFVKLFESDNTGFIWGLDVFFIVHMILHLLFLLHKNNAFKDFLSWSIISGAAVFGALDLIVEF